MRATPSASTDARALDDRFGQELAGRLLVRARSIDAMDELAPGLWHWQALVDFGDGLHINPRWLDPDVTREQVVEGLRPLLDLPVEHVLATHGGPFDRAALERALS